MSVANINGTVVRQSAYQQARASVENMQGGNLRPGDVLAAIQQLTSSVNVSTNTRDFSGNSGMHLGIHPSMLRRAADDPEELVRLKALALCTMETQAASTQAWESRGITVVARGSIIHADGSSSGWSITRSPDLREERRNRFELPEDDRPSWVELMRQHLEESMREAEENQPSHLEDENSTRNWIA